MIFDRVFVRIIHCLSISTQVVLVLMVASVGYDSLMRYAFAMPTSWSQEINAFLMVYLALVPAAHVAWKDEHMNITFFVRRLSPKTQIAGRLFVVLAGLALSGVMARHGFTMALQAWTYGNRMSSTLGTPMFLPYALIPIGFGLLLIYFVFALIRTVAALGRGGQPAGLSREIEGQRQQRKVT